MCNIKFSIIYAVIRPEINEQLSVGVILVGDEKPKFRYSERKLRAVKELFSPKQYEFFDRMVRGLESSGAIDSIEGINYLIRYSNNMMALSPLQDIDLPLNEETSDWVFTQYIDRSARVGA